jgi:hypothetical protein
MNKFIRIGSEYVNAAQVKTTYPYTTENARGGYEPTVKVVFLDETYRIFFLNEGIAETRAAAMEWAHTYLEKALNS